MSVGEDSILNVYQIENSSGVKNLKNTAKVDLEDEIYTITSNSIDRIALGGATQKVDIHQINGSSKISLDAPELAMQFSSPV